MAQSWSGPRAGRPAGCDEGRRVYSRRRRAPRVPRGDHRHGGQLARVPPGGERDREPALGGHRALPAGHQHQGGVRGHAARARPEVGKNKRRRVVGRGVRVDEFPSRAPAAGDVRLDAGRGARGPVPAVVGAVPPARAPGGVRVQSHVRGHGRLVPREPVPAAQRALRELLARRSGRNRARQRREHRLCVRAERARRRAGAQGVKRDHLEDVRHPGARAGPGEAVGRRCRARRQRASLGPAHLQRRHRERGFFARLAPSQRRASDRPEREQTTVVERRRGERVPEKHGLGVVRGTRS